MRAELGSVPGAVPFGGYSVVGCCTVDVACGVFDVEFEVVLCVADYSAGVVEVVCDVGYVDSVEEDEYFDEFFDEED